MNNVVVLCLAHPKTIFCCLAIGLIVVVAMIKGRRPTPSETFRIFCFFLAAYKAVGIALIALSGLDDPVNGDTNLAMLIGALVVGFAGGEAIVETMKRLFSAEASPNKVATLPATAPANATPQPQPATHVRVEDPAEAERRAAAEALAITEQAESEARTRRVKATK